MSERGRSSLYLILTRIYKSFQPKVSGKLVAKDHLGNAYYEIPADPSKGVRNPKRWYKRDNEDDWDIPLPPEWEAWLRYRRSNPPTTEEIEKNLLIMRMKKQSDVNKKELLSPSEKNLIDAPKKSAFSDFPVYKEYEQNPGWKDKDGIRNKDKGDY